MAKAVFFTPIIPNPLVHCHDGEPGFTAKLEGKKLPSSAVRFLLSSEAENELDQITNMNEYLG